MTEVIDLGGFTWKWPKKFELPKIGGTLGTAWKDLTSSVAEAFAGKLPEFDIPSDTGEIVNVPAGMSPTQKALAIGIPAVLLLGGVLIMSKKTKGGKQ